MPEIESQLTPQYPGDDTRPTSKKELAGWYSYGWAAEAFVVCAMGSFLPVTLEQMARDQGHPPSDKSARCDSGQVVLREQFFAASRPSESSQCVVSLLGLEINTASFAMYTFSVSVLVQALLIITMSGAADHGSYRKSLLVAFAFVGSISMMLFLAVRPEAYYIASILAIVANTCFGSSFVLLNSFLPLLVRHHPAYLGADHNSFAGNGREEQPDANSPLLQSRDDLNGSTIDDDSARTVLRRSSIALQLSTRISSNGMGIAYIGSVILQISCIVVIMLTHQTTFSLRLVMFLIGLWWFLFTAPAILWLRPRPGPPLPPSSSRKGRRTWLGYMAYSWLSLGKTITHARRLKDVGLFLAAWFLLSDGVATVGGTAILFAKTELDMRPAALGLISVIGTVSAVVGAFSWSYVSRLFNLQTIHTIIVCICLLELIPLYGLLGFIPAVRNLGFGLQHPWEVYPLGAIYGLTMGGLSAYCRSLFGELIPPGYETAFYALYAITDKGSSIFGPAIVGAVTDRYGEIRPAFAFLAAVIFLSLPLMLLVDVDRGKADAMALAAELDGRQKTDGSGYQSIPHGQLVDDEGEQSG